MVIRRNRRSAPPDRRAAGRRAALDSGTKVSFSIQRRTPAARSSIVQGGSSRAACASASLVQRVDDRRAGAALARGERIVVGERPSVRREERQRGRPSCSRRRTRFEERRQLAGDRDSAASSAPDALGLRDASSASSRAELAEISRVAQRAVERADRRVTRHRRKRKCGDRSSATSADRENALATSVEARSSAAAVGSAASGSASEI